METKRLNSFIADSGFCSRRQADQLISEGQVTVNGKLAVLGLQVSVADDVRVRGKRVQPKSQQEKVYIALNKPRGIICTTDLRQDHNIIDFMDYPERIFPIGRLDRDSEGLILLTNDGSIVNRILRAGNRHEKEYIVEVNREITPEFLKGMSEGVPILDRITAPCRLRKIDKTHFRIILTQGLNRQIRRMCEYFGYDVRTLRRLRIMHITLGQMPSGTWRYLSHKELQELKRLLSHSVSALDEFDESDENSEA